MLRLAWPRALRRALAGALILMVVVILSYFVSHRRPVAVAHKVEGIPARQVEKQEGIEHIDFRGDRRIHAKADTYYKGDDGLFHLENNVEVRDLANKDGKEICISGDKVTYDKDWTEARLEGKGKVKYGDLTFESAAFDYRKSGDALTTDRGVIISSTKLNGSARQLSYTFKDEVIHLEGDAELRAEDKSENPSPLVVRGSVLTYRRRERTGLGENGVTYSLGESGGAARTIDFRMTDDEHFLLMMNLKGQAQARLIEDERPGADNSLLSRTREIDADEIDTRAFLNMNKLHTIEARGGCSLSARTPGGSRVGVNSSEMKIVLDRWGGLREYWATGRASLVERGQGSAIERTIAGQEIYIEGPGEILKTRAGEAGDASVDSAEIEITGGEIDLVPRTEDLSAAGDVKIVLKPQSEGSGSGGLFSTAAPVLAVTKRMSYEKGKQRLVMSEGMRMWQGKQTLSAKELAIERATGAIQGIGAIRAVFPQAPKQGTAKEDRIEIGGENLGSDPQAHLLTFEKSCWLKTQNVDLKSERIVVHLGEDQGAIRTIQAEKKVSIVSGLREGKGETAFYDLSKDTIELTGHPTLTDKVKGVIEGDKLTFYLTDGRIHVENRDRERSVTVIKS